MHHAHLGERVAAGAVIKKTMLTEAFGLEDFRQTYGTDAVPLVVLTASGKLRVAMLDRDLELGPGDKIVALVDRPAPSPG